MDYNFSEIEKAAHEKWAKEDIYKVSNDSTLPKYYVLDMFPYPSGAGLHVGHPLGYIASDIFSRFKRLKGFNVLHPMGWDAFGLPAEQYAIQTGQHPSITTEQNLARYRSQMDMLGFSYDWSREVKTSDPAFYKWTQWIFLKLFKSWYNNKTQKAEPIENLIGQFEKSGTNGIDAAAGEEVHFSADEWKSFSEKKQSDVLFYYRLAYLSEAWVNWCPALGTVLANDEVKDGVSERGGYPVERKLMPQWSLRITAYAGRLLNDLDTIEWSESIKEAQRNWIGRSEGSSLQFKLESSVVSTSLNDPIERPLSEAEVSRNVPSDNFITVFTTRADTVFGVTFITLAPENELVNKITPSSHKAKVDEYVNTAKNKTERERQAEKKVSGVFTGAYAIHPFTGNKIPVWVGDYVLAGYGTGAVMGVPAHDSRDHAFAKHFNLGIPQVIEAPADWDFSKESYDGKEGKCINSDFLNGLEVKDAVKHAIEEIEKRGLGKGKVNFRLRDAAFGRQRYWGEPIPIYYKPVVSDQSSGVSEIPVPLDESELPLILPEIDNFKPTESGDPPLARATNWKYKGEYHYEYTTMPGWAGSSWYYLRYMDPKNPDTFASAEAINYWQNVDLYIGGAEHATGHLLYFRFWTKFLNDYGLVPFVEPAKKLVNQGMIQGLSAFAFRLNPIFNISIDSEESVVWPVIYVSPKWVQKIKTDESVREELKNLFKNAFARHNPNRKFEVSTRHFREYDSWFFYTRVPVNLVSNDNILDKERFKSTTLDSYKDMQIAIEFFPDDDSAYICPREVEKMSKSKWNVVTPDDVIAQYGADTMRMYEMFLGPLELSKPWSTQGISGVYGFLRKFWRMFFNSGSFDSAQPPSKSDIERSRNVLPGEQSQNASIQNEFYVSDDKATPAELKILHKTIKKIDEDIERLSFNTAVSAFMICLNELYDLKCNKREILEPLVVCLSPFAPHIAEELWGKLRHDSSVVKTSFPAYQESYLVENTFSYPVSFNGKTRFMLELPLNLTKEQIEKEVLSSEDAKKWLKEVNVKKVIVVPNKIVNIVV